MSGFSIYTHSLLGIVRPQPLYIYMYPSLLCCNIHIHTYVYVYMCVYMYVCTHSMRIKMYILHIYNYVGMYKYVCMYVSTYVCFVLCRLIRFNERFRRITNTLAQLMPRILSVFILFLILYYFFAVIGMESFSQKIHRGCCKSVKLNFIIVYKFSYMYRKHQKFCNKNLIACHCNFILFN